MTPASIPSRTTDSSFAYADVAAAETTFLHALLDALPNPVAVIDEGGTILQANSKMVALFPPQAMPSSVAAWMASAPSESGQQFLSKLLPIRNSTGPRYSLLCLEPDNAETQELIRQRDAHERLFNAVRTQSVGEMATVLSHELNQPLGAIINYLDAGKKLLVDLPDLPPRALKAITLAQNQATQAAAIIARLREFISARQVRREFSHVGELLARNVDLLQWDLQQHHVQLQLNVDPELPAVALDAILIGQVVTNLIQNALQAMAGVPVTERVLHIYATLDLEQRIIVRISDSGTGISREDQLKLFTPFHTTKPKGMGVGLAMCRSIMELHAGSLYLENADHRGSTFCFTLPTGEQ